MDTVDHHGRTTAYRLADRGGTGTPLLCVHGSGGSHEVWKAQLARLASERPVIAIDLSGHGESTDIDTAPGEATLQAYAEDVVAVAEATEAGALAGNSLGGAVVLQVALATDFEPAALLLVGTGARLSVRADLLEALRSDFESAIETLHGNDLLLHTDDPRYHEMSRAALRAAGRDITYRDFATCDRFDVRDRLASISVPTLALTGEYDELTPPWYHEYLADQIPNAEWTTIPEAAHLSMLEQPSAFNDAVSTFLDTRCDPG
ncbi:MAG: alpha/beta hydrolase [Halobacteriales archaeon]|nr:alpha/beta hydrolase [Halobacteriales archaeon]